MAVLDPIANALQALLAFFYGFTHDYAISVVLMTLIVKLVLHPLTRIQLRSMKAMQVLQPHMEALRRKHKENPKSLNQEMMALYRAHNVNPMMGCLPMLVQMPVLWALFQLLNRKGLFGNAAIFGIPWLRLDEVPQQLYGRIATQPEVLLVFIIPLLVALSTWYQQKMSVTDPQQARMFMFMPIMIGYFATLYQIGLSIYWIVSTVAYIGEYLLVVGQPHPMAAALPKSQAQAGGTSGGKGPGGGARGGGQPGRPRGEKGAKQT